MIIICSVIVTFNGEKWIKRCLDSLIKSSIKTDIIVIDNQSSDSTFKIIQTYYPQVTLIQSGKNLGFGKANNIGFKFALQHKAEYILLLNQDSWINPDTLSLMINQYEADKTIGILAPVNFNSDGTEMEKGCEQELTSINCPSFMSDLYFNKIRKIYYINNYFNASCWLVSRQCLEKTGGFDPLFSHYGEDVNYCMRIRFHGFMIAITTITNSFHAKDNFKPNLNAQMLLSKNTKTNYLNNYLLNKLTDLNLNYTQAFIEETFSLLGLIVKYMLKFRKTILFVYIDILIFILKNSLKIKKHRFFYINSKTPFII